MPITYIPVYGDTVAAVDDTHRFGTDAMLLSHFAMSCSGESVCELGTGCGAIALRLAAGGRPASVHGVDIQPAAIALAQRGADRFDGTPKPTFAVGDWRDPRSIAPAGSYRRVVCNPPYFPAHSGPTALDEAVALCRHEQEDTLDSLCAAAAWLLQSGGRFFLCHRPERLSEVLAALTAHHLEPKRLQAVQKRTDTAPWLFLLEAKKDAHAGLSWLPPLVLYTDEGASTPAMQEIYREVTV
ncbi:MAG: methyltransferase [Clostridia bacterium]|nr:methyltransferase [Clostridia bacterium]